MTSSHSIVGAGTNTQTQAAGARLRHKKRSVGQRSPHDLIQNHGEGWTLRRRVASLLRKAFRVVFMGRQRSLGRLSGGGAAVTALLMSMGLMLASTGAQAQSVSGGNNNLQPTRVFPHLMESGGFPNQLGSDSSYLLGSEASTDGSTLFP